MVASVRARYTRAEYLSLERSSNAKHEFLEASSTPWRGVRRSTVDEVYRDPLAGSTS